MLPPALKRFRDKYPKLRLPCYRWHRAIVVPQGHPLVTYSFSFGGPASLIELFAEESLTPNVALTA